MERPELRIVAPGASARGAGVRGRWTGLALAGCLALGAVVATLAGADEARRTFDPRELVRDVAVPAMTGGVDEPRVVATLRRLHGRLHARPLDASTRVVYAALITAISRNADDAELARFHARAAARTAPVTVPVVRYAAHVLADLGDLDSALAECRRISTFDPDAAAELLARLEPYAVAERRVADGLGDTPVAWGAWIDRLRALGRGDEADGWLERAQARWPEDLALRERLALRLADRGAWTRLERIVGAREIPAERRWARLIATRGLAFAADGRRADAASDLTLALELASDDVGVLTTSGDLALRLGDAVDARDLWARALHLAEASGYEASIVELLVRLAQLHESTSEPARALRYWSRVVEREPEHALATVRVREIGGDGGAAPP